MAKKTEKYIVTALNKETGNREALSIGELTFEYNMNSGKIEITG